MCQQRKNNSRMCEQAVCFSGRKVAIVTIIRNIVFLLDPVHVYHCCVPIYGQMTQQVTGNASNTAMHLMTMIEQLYGIIWYSTITCLPVLWLEMEATKCLGMHGILSS